MAEVPVVSLAESIRALRDELAEAERTGAGSDIRFRLKPIMLTVQTVVRREAGINGKIRWWLVEASAEGKVISESTHTLQLELEPLRVTPAGEILLVEVEQVTPEPGE
jgi:hypothetical protein